MLFVAVDPSEGTLPCAWLVPSEEFERAFSKPNAQGRYVFAASMKERTRDRWSKYRCVQSELPGVILAALDDLTVKARTV